MFQGPKLEPGPKTVRGLGPGFAGELPRAGRGKNYFFDLVVFFAAAFFAGAFFAGAFFAMALVPPFFR